MRIRQSGRGARPIARPIDPAQPMERSMWALELAITAAALVGAAVLFLVR